MCNWTTSSCHLLWRITKREIFSALKCSKIYWDGRREMDPKSMHFLQGNFYLSSSSLTPGWKTLVPQNWLCERQDMQWTFSCLTGLLTFNMIYQECLKWIYFKMGIRLQKNHSGLIVLCETVNTNGTMVDELLKHGLAVMIQNSFAAHKCTCHTHRYSLDLWGWEMFSFQCFSVQCPFSPLWV